METLYKPEGVEERWEQTWEEEGHYNADPDPARESFVIAHPPPNVTGDLHMGHAMQLSLADTIVRTRRMQGYNTLFQPGFDHAGISTQNAVEKHLALEGKTRQDLGREAFVERGLGVAAGVRRQDHASVPAHRRVDGLPPRALHDGRRLRARGDALLRASVRQRLDLPRESNHQLVPVPPDVALRSRGRARGGGRCPDLRPLPARRRRRPHHDRNGEAGDDPGRRGRGGTSG